MVPMNLFEIKSLVFLVALEHVFPEIDVLQEINWMVGTSCEDVEERHIDMVTNSLEVDTKGSNIVKDTLPDNSRVSLVTIIQQ